MILYVAIFSIMCLFCALWGIRLTSKIFNPLTVFCGIWSMIFFLSSLQLYDIKRADNRTFGILMLGTVFYIVGFVADHYLFKNRRLTISATSKGHREYVPRYGLIYVLMIFTLVFTIIKARNSIGILLEGGNLDAVLQATRANSANARRTIGNVINNLIIGPFTFAIFPICAYNIANKQKLKLTILVLLQLMIGIASSGGRAFLIYLMVLMSVCFTFAGNYSNRIQKKNQKTNKKRFAMLIGIFIFLFILLSISRSGQDIFRHMYLYFSMQPVLFEIWADSIDLRHLYGFGEATFNGFTFHFLYLVKNIFGVPFPANWNKIFNVIIETDSNWVPITNAGVRANAYVSAFWYYYLDARILGVVFFSSLFGAISSSFFRRALIMPNMKNICLYGMVLFAVVDTYVRIRSADGSFCAGLLLIAFVLFKKKGAKEKSWPRV